MVYVTAKGTAYRREVARLAMAAGLHRLRFAGRVWAEYDCYPPDRRTRDLSNLLKCLEDALVDAGIIQDDGQIDGFRMRRQEIRRPGGVEVALYEASGNNQD